MKVKYEKERINTIATNSKTVYFIIQGPESFMLYMYMTYSNLDNAFFFFRKII